MKFELEPCESQGFITAVAVITVVLLICATIAFRYYVKS